MTLRHLRIFLTVCQYGTTIAAAGQLNISQPTVSGAISEMERFYGVRLFDRIDRRLRLSDSGQQLRSYALHIVSLFDQMEREVRDFETMGALRIGSSITIATAYLPDFLLQLQAIHPHLRAEVTVCNSGDVEKALLNNQLDIGFVEGLTHPGDLYWKEFMQDQLVFLCHPGHPFAGRQEIPAALLKEHPWLLREKGSAGRELTDNIMTFYGLDVNPVWQSISTQAMLAAVQAGLGLALLPMALVCDAITAGKVACFSVSGCQPTRNFAVVHHRNKYLTKGMQTLLQIVCQPAKTSE